MKEKRIHLTIVFLVSLIATGLSQSYTYPVIPDSIKDRQDRISFMAVHFWDYANFADSSLLAEPKPFFDYIYLLQSLPEEKATECIQNGLWSISSQPFGFEWLMFWLDRYVHNPQSPYYNDAFFLQFLGVLLETATDEGQLNELSYYKEMAQRNPIGDVAEDFSFILKDNTEKKLSEVEAPLLLLIFNSPDCSLCHRLENEISNDSLIQQMVTFGQMTIVAISPNANHEDWLNHVYPKNWICGFDRDMTITTKKLYEIRQFPSIYLLDNNKHVILKEADYEVVVSFLSKY
jgi:thioredoxin-related protein